MTRLSDRDIQLHIENALSYNPQTHDARVAVRVKEGVATLHGEVTSHAQKLAVERVVKGIAGVRGFAEELKTTPPAHHKRSDEEIVKSALEALHWNVVVPDEHIQVKAEHGWLTLLGTVTWKTERDAAETAVSLLPGVLGVSNHIQLKPRAKPKAVRESIAQAFARTARLDANDIAITVDGASVTLSGTVATWAEFEDADKAAWACPGVSNVLNLLKVAGGEQATLTANVVDTSA